MRPSASELGRFREAVLRSFGLLFDDSRTAQLSEVFERRLAATGLAGSAYLERLEGLAVAPDEVRQLAHELTVGETYFLRHAEQFRAFVEVALRERMVARASVRQLRLLSAGCASGEEPYSLALLVRERALGPEWSVSVRGVDLNAVALERAARARYSTWSLRETPPELQRRYFTAEGRDFVLSPALQSAVTFEQRNLAHDDPELWPPSHYDVVFCRNVLMYLGPDVAQRLVARMAQSLAPGGFLFVGHADTLRGLSPELSLRHTHDTFYYQRSEQPSRAAPVPEPPASAALWTEQIERASERIRALTQKAPEVTAGPRFVAPRAPLDAALALLESERFGEALAALGALPSAAQREPEALLLRAVLLLHTGDCAGAESACSELLSRDALAAGAHHVLSLCREAAGDRAGAVTHERRALFLDPTLAMARVHLGLLARHAGDREGAQRELGQALLLLQSEEPGRLRLFGGGFGREALVALCRAEIAASGGRA